MRFIGTTETKVDPKGRTVIPVAFRRVLKEHGEERVVLRKDDFQPCLVIYPESVWSALVDTVRPPRYLQMAAIDTAVMIIGMDDSMELWADDGSGKPFMEPADFVKAMQQIMNPENDNDR